MEIPPHISFHHLISALAYSFARAEADGGQPPFDPPYNDLTEFIVRQNARLPDYLRLPLKALAAMFDLGTIPSTGQRFSHLPPARRQRRIEAWRKSRLSFQRDLIRYFESLATLGLFSRNENVAPDQPQRFRILPRVIHLPDHTLRHEIVVIGSGPGGAITAALLAEAGRDVLLLEEGEYLPLESCGPFSRQEMEQKYRNGGQTVALGAAKIAYVEGRCVGGGSEINSGLYHRTPPDILERWRREFGVANLTEADMLPHFEACERDVSVSLLPGTPPAASLKLHEGARRFGWNSMEVPRWFRYDGTENNGTRQSMTATFIPRLLSANGRLLPQTRALRLQRNVKGWKITAEHSTVGRLEISAETVFVCAGAIHTPALLRRSGITRNIGRSLKLHPTLKVTALFPDAVNGERMGVPVHQVKEFSPRLSFGCSVSTPAYLALGLLDHPNQLRRVPAQWTRMANYYAMITGEGGGTVCQAPGFRDPIVKYRLGSQDLRDLADGLRKLSELLMAAGAEAVFPASEGGPVLNSRDQLRKLPVQLAPGLANLMTIHLFSTCPMGEIPERCATDSFGRVRETDGLHIHDASLLCTAPGVNPQGTIMALARRNTLRFLNCL